MKVLMAATLTNSVPYVSMVRIGQLQSTQAIGPRLPRDARARARERGRKDRATETETELQSCRASDRALSSHGIAWMARAAARLLPPLPPPSPPRCYDAARRRSRRATQKKKNTNARRKQTRVRPRPRNSAPDFVVRHCPRVASRPGASSRAPRRFFFPWFGSAPLAPRSAALPREGSHEDSDEGRSVCGGRG